MLRRALVTVLGLAIAAASSAQQFQVGNLPASPSYQVPGITAVDIDAASPASGALSSATFGFSSFPCPAAIKIKVFTRPNQNGIRCCPAIGFVDERGPFDVTQALQTVPLNPPLLIAQGGLLGISSVSSCGHPLGLTGGTHRVAIYSSDVRSEQGLPIVPTEFLPHVDNVTLALAAFGTQTFFTEVSGTIPVLFTGSGAAASHFRTEFRIYNPTAATISGALRWTPSDSSLRPSSTPYTLAAFEVQAVDTPAGLPPFESVDIIPSTGPGPAASAHVFNDLGSSGTLGFTEADVSPGEALRTSGVGVLLGPSDPANFRLNIGFRALDAQAFLLITARRKDGSTAASTYRSAESFVMQIPFQYLLGIPLEPSMTVTCEVISGSAFVYGVTADNRTNDASFQMARPIAGSGS